MNPDDTFHKLEKQLEQLKKELAETRDREVYYREIAANTGRKRLRETRALSDLVSHYKDAQTELAKHRNELESLVAERTQKLAHVNEELRERIEEQRLTAEQLKFRLQLDQVILEISTDFINMPIEKTDDGIAGALEKISTLINVPRCAIYMLTDQNDSVLNTHEYSRENKPQQKSARNIHDDCFVTYSELLHRQKDVILSQPSDLRKLLKNTYSFKDKDFQPFVAIPMMQSGMIYGAFVLYGRQGQNREWAPEVISFAKIIGGVFVNALERKMSELALRESEEDYRDVVDKAGLAIFIEAFDGSFHYFNQRFEELFGFSRQELENMVIFDLIHKDDRKIVRQNHQNRFQDLGAPTHYEFRGLRKDKSIVFLEVDIVELRSDGKLMAARGYLWDVTKRVQTERAIQESEERYRKLVENFIDIVYIIDYDWNLLYANPALSRITGYSLEDVNNLETKTLLIHPDDLDKCKTIIIAFLQSDALYSERFECRTMTKDGDVRITSNIVSKVAFRDRHAMQCISHDITEQKQAERALKKSADFERTVSEITGQFVDKDINDQSILRSLAVMGKWSEASRVSLYRIPAGGRELFCSHTWCAEGVPSHENENRELPSNNLKWWDEKWKNEELLHLADIEELPSQFDHEKEILRSLEIKSLIFLPFKVRGRIYGALSFEDVAVTGPWSDEDVRLLHIASEILGNALERMQAEKMLVKSEEQYRMLFDSNNDGIYLFGFDHEHNPTPFMNVNAMACRRLGYSKEEMLGMSILDIEAPSQTSVFSDRIRTLLETKHFLAETTFKTKSGETYPVEIKSNLIELDGRPVALAIERDITERKRIEEEVQKSQRLESIGLLAGGIAHDFNNLLSIILGNAQLVSLMGAQGGDTSKYIRNIEKGITQATNLTQQLLTFSKGGAPIKMIIDIGPLIHDAANLALSGMDESAEIEIENDLWHVEVDRGQIRQVLQNLVLNADQAMPNGGVINVLSRNCLARDIPELASLRHENYVEIRITDHGIGIPKADQSKVFDPYYTTKKKGSGLGLAVAYSIVKKHDGLITLKSEVGVGTSIAVYLPAADAQQKAPTIKASAPFKHYGKILIMDDEELVLEMTGDMLRELGYSVELVKEGGEAVQAYKQAMDAKSPFDAVIMDLTIPAGMGGRQAVGEVLKLDPKAKVIVSSGYSNDKVLSRFSDYGFAGMAAKPYTLAELSKVLMEVLSARD